MKVIKVNGFEYNIPTSWQDVSIEMYQRFLKVEKGDVSAQLECLTGIDKELISQSNILALSPLLEVMSKLLETKPSEQLQLKFTHNGHEYEIMPNESLTFGQLVDWEVIITKGNIMDSLHLLIAIRTVKPTEKYTAELVNERADQFKSLPINIANGYAAFFLNLPKNTEMLSEYSSLLEEEVKNRMNTLWHSIKNGTGTQRFTALQKMILLKLRMCYVKIAIRHYGFYAIKKKKV